MLHAAKEELLKANALQGLKDIRRQLSVCKMSSTLSNWSVISGCQSSYHVSYSKDLSEPLSKVSRNTRLRALLKMNKFLAAKFWTHYSLSKIRKIGKAPSIWWVSSSSKRSCNPMFSKIWQLNLTPVQTEKIQPFYMRWLDSKETPILQLLSMS